LASWSCTQALPPRLPLQDLISRLLERKPAKRLGMLNGRAKDIKQHRWFEGMPWEELEARRTVAQRKPKESDSSKRLKVRLTGALSSKARLSCSHWWCCRCYADTSLPAARRSW
jgi:serine/threonine protein kinase